MIGLLAAFLIKSLLIFTGLRLRRLKDMMNIQFMVEMEIYLESEMEVKYKNTFCKCNFAQNRSHFQWKLYC